MTTAVATAPRKPLTIREKLSSDEFRHAVAQVLPKHLTPDRFLRIAILATTRTPKLLQCTQTSLFNALLTLSQLGIEPDGRRAHLIPFENRKTNVTECQLIIDYKGLAELAMRSGVVSTLHADVVCEHDEFEYDRGELKRHRIDFRKPRGAVYAVYAVAQFKDGSQKCEVMTMDEVNAIRKRSRAGNNGPWVTDFAEMAKKTVFRRLSKWLPLSPEFRDAAEADEDGAIDISTSAPSALVATTSAFEIPEETGNGNGTATDDSGGSDNSNADDKAEAEQGLAPVVDQPKVELAEFVLNSGHTFTQFQAWGEGSGNVPEAGSYADFHEVPSDIAKRLLRSKKGLLEGLKVAKGGAAA